jgi:hypothetical protein
MPVASRDDGVARTNHSPSPTLSGRPIPPSEAGDETDGQFQRSLGAKRQVNRARTAVRECFDGHQKFRASGCNAVGPIYESSYDLATGWVLKTQKIQCLCELTLALALLMAGTEPVTLQREDPGFDRWDYRFLARQRVE